MIRLYRTPRYQGLLGGVSPYVYKLETWLRLAGITYEETVLTVWEIFSAAPRDLIPFVDLDGERLDDSNIIIARLKDLHNDPLNDDRLTQAERVQGELIKSLCEHELFYILSYGRWTEGDYKTHGEFIFDFLPDEKRSAAIERHCAIIRKQQHVWRIGRYDSDFVKNELRKNLDTLSYSLGEGPWLFGKEPCTYDAGLFAMLASIIHYPLPDPQVEISREYDSLVKYCDRIRKTCYGYDPEIR